MQRLLGILGPTASGKTALGIELAQSLNGEIISVDSMQVYQGMDIGTAKPSPAELAQAPHHLIDIISPDQAYNAGIFCEQAHLVLEEICTRGKLPILLGGTHLYHRAFLYGIIPVPDISPTIKTRIQNWMEEGGLAHCYTQLQSLDPAAAQRLHPHDISRIHRALEVVLQTGQSIDVHHQSHGFQEPKFKILYLAPHWERKQLYERINLRVIRMVQSGLLEETQALLDQGYNPQLQPMRSIGYKQAVMHLQGQLGLEEMIDEIQKQTRRYAKKQLTWLKAMEGVHWLEEGEDLNQLLPQIQDFLQGQDG